MGSVVTQITSLLRKGVTGDVYAYSLYLVVTSLCYIESPWLHHVHSNPRTSRTGFCACVVRCSMNCLRVVYFKKRPNTCNTPRVRTGNVFPLMPAIISLTVNLSVTVYDEQYARHVFVWYHCIYYVCKLSVFHMYKHCCIHRWAYIPCECVLGVHYCRCFIVFDYANNETRKERLLHTRGHTKIL
jgi:hypothetical protein